MADMLGRNGYLNRALVGKWHLGHSRKAYYPLTRGFTHFYGLLNASIDYFTHEREGEPDWHDDWGNIQKKVRIFCIAHSTLPTIHIRLLKKRVTPLFQRKSSNN